MLASLQPHISEAQPTWLREFRQERFAYWQRLGVPTRKVEAWRYLDLAHLNQQAFSTVAETHAIDITRYQSQNVAQHIAIVNGNYNAALSDVNDVRVLNLQEAIATLPQMQSIIAKRQANNPFGALNDGTLDDAVVVVIPADCLVSSLQISCIVTQDQFFDASRLIFVGEPNSAADILLHYVGEADHYWRNQVTQISLAQGATLKLTKLQRDAITATHFDTICVTQQKDSSLQLTQIAKGARVARADVWVDLVESGAHCQLNGLIQCGGEQTVDHHLYVNHQCSDTYSEQCYKTILDGNATAVFDGKVTVAKNAQRINAEQQNHNILLSPKASVNTKPELEIYADDVKCSHGATIGQLDQQALYYLRSRGIPFAVAQAMLLAGFADEVILRSHYSEEVRQWMS